MSHLRVDWGKDEKKAIRDVSGRLLVSVNLILDSQNGVSVRLSIFRHLHPYTLCGLNTPEYILVLIRSLSYSALKTNAEYSCVSDASRDPSRANCTVHQM